MNEKDNNKPLTILQWAEEDRPREKLSLKGKASLSDAELIAILIGSGTKSLSAVEVAKLILKNCDNDINLLAKQSIKDLVKNKGIGEAKAISIISALELGRRRKAESTTKVTPISNSRHIFELMIPILTDLPHEEFWIILLNRANIVIKTIQISKGGVAGTVVDSKIIFKSAIEFLANSIILVHNHPSGNLKPSQEDITITKKLKQQGTLIEIPILDHIIFTNSNYYSFADEGQI
jgi:DNA repair protein RadC